MFILKSLSDENAHYGCEVSVYDTHHEAYLVMETQIKKCCDESGFHPSETPDSIENLFVQLERDTSSASLHTGGTTYVWEIIEFPEYARDQAVASNKAIGN